MKRKFASKADEGLMARRAGLANAAKRRLGGNNPQNFIGRKSGGPKGAVSGGGGLGVGQSFTPNPSGKFTPRTPTGRPNFGKGKSFDIKFGMQPKTGEPGTNGTQQIGRYRGSRDIVNAKKFPIRKS